MVVEEDTDEFEMLKDKTDIAIERAKRLEEYHRENGESLPFKLHVNPFTEVYRLVKKIK